MWTFEYSVASHGDPDVVWGIWADPAEMRRLPGMASIRGEGPISSGSPLTARVRGALPQRQRVTEYEEGRRFVFESRQPGLVARYDHVLEQLEDGGSRLTESVALSGPGAGLVGVLFGWMIARSVRRIVDDVAAAAQTRPS